MDGDQRITMGQRVVTSTGCGGTAREVAFEVDRGDLERCRVVRSAVPAIAEGQVLITVERFAFTANNVSYAVLGDELGYWRLFPAAQGWGRIPVWGHGVVAQSRHTQLGVGIDVYGLLPMSTHVVITPGELRRGWFRDAAVHRADLSPVYNAYQVIAGWDADRRDRQALLAPVFMLSFLLDAFLGEHEQFGAERVVITSASSKVALGLAHLLRRRGVPVTGVTSARNAGFVDGLGAYGAVATYDDVDGLGDRTATVIDVAGDHAVANALADVLGDRLRRQVRAGFARQTLDAPGAAGGRGPATLFFAPDEMIARTRRWGRSEFQDRFAVAFDGFAQWTTEWLRLVRASGADAVDAAYHRARRGHVAPTDGVILSLHPAMPG